MRWLSISVLLCSFGWCALVAAQETELPPAPPPPPGAATPPPAAAPAPGTPPPPPTYQTAPTPAAAAPTAPAEPAPAAACSPACRPGFSCVNSQCMSSCNPPCGAGQTCTADGQCIAAHPASGAPPGRFFANGAGDMLAKDPTAERHDGFMLRLTLGFGGGTVTRHIKNDPLEVLGGDGKTTFSGFGEHFSLDIGGAPTENLIISGRLSTFGLINPKVKRRGESLDANDDDGGASILIGPAITYYFMPVNLYLTGALGLGVARRDA